MMARDPFAEEQAARKASIIHELGPARPTGETCQCGREIAMLSPASDAPKCKGCGYVPDLCTCLPPGQQQWPWYRTHPELGDHPDEGATER